MWQALPKKERRQQQQQQKRQKSPEGPLLQRAVRFPGADNYSHSSNDQAFWWLWVGGQSILVVVGGWTKVRTKTAIRHLRANIPTLENSNLHRLGFHWDLF